MADETNIQGVAEEGERNGRGPETAVKKRGKLKLILLVLIVIFVGAGGAYFVFQTRTTAASSGTGESAEKKKEPIGPILSLDPFIFNIGGSNTKYAKITLGVEVKDEKVMEEAKKMVPAVRDKALSVLGAKGPEALMDINNRNNLKQELYTSLKAIFRVPTDLKSVYITDIIIQ